MGDTAITVAVRARPLFAHEEAPKEPVTFHTGCVKTSANKSFNYDYVFPAQVSNEAVYNLAVADKIHPIFKGYNVTILAYGSTGSGKTYTMGTDFNPRKSFTAETGIIPRGINEIFRVLESEKDTKEFSLKVSFLEIHKEIVYDLLSEEVSVCQLREMSDGNFKVLNLTQIPVSSIEEAFDMLAKGSGLRQTSATAKNAKSSRSHAIFSVYVQQTDKASLASKRAKFQLVDLAGSERMNASKTVGVQVKEGININLGLLVLGKVICALSEEKSHVPYRESQLTRLLKDSLGGNSHTVMIACINPSASSTDETLSTLRYAYNTRRIKNRPVVNVDPPAVQIAKLQRQVESLQAALLNKQSQGSSHLDGSSVQQLQGAYVKIGKLHDKLLKLEEANSDINKKLKSFYEEIKAIVADITVAVGSDGALQSHLEKLELIQSECLELMAERNLTHSIEVAELNSQSMKSSENDESSEFVSPSELEEPRWQNVEPPKPRWQNVEPPEPPQWLVEDTPEFKIPTTKDEALEQLVADMEGVVSSLRYLDKLTDMLEMKEDMARQMQDNLDGYETSGDEERDLDLKKQLQVLTKEKSDLEAAMKKTEAKLMKEMQEKVDSYEVQIKTLEEELRKNTKSIQKKKESQAQMQSLQFEIKNLKQTKVQIMKQMKDNANRHMRIQRQKDKDIAKLEREGRKKDIEFSKMKSKFANQMRVLQTKVSQATASKTKLLQALQKKKPGQAGVKPKQSQEGLEEWVEEELKIVVADDLVKVEVESLEKDADTLKDHIKKIEQLTPNSQDDALQRSDADQLKADLQVVLEQIADMRKQIKEDRTAKSCIVLDGVTNLSEAKPVIEYLFKKCAAGEVEAAKQLQITSENLKKQQAINESSEEKIEMLNKEVKSLKDEMAKYKAEQEQNTSSLKWEYDSKLLNFMAELQSANRSSLTEGIDPIIAKRVEMQEKEIEKLQSLRIMYEKKCAEVDKLHQEFFKIKKGKRSKWLSDLSNFPDAPTSLEDNKAIMESYLAAEEENRSMMEEYLSEESFTNDQNDPDWRLTPLHKQLKKSRLERKAILNAASKKDVTGSIKSQDTGDSSSDSESVLKRSFSSCQCLGECKTMRCGCRKRRAVCSDSCSCDKEHCVNAVCVSTSDNCSIPTKKIKLFFQD